MVDTKTAVATAREAGRLSRKASRDVRRLDGGVPGAWKAELAINGLSQERRDELMDGLEAADPDMQRMPPVGDGIMRLRGRMSPGFSMQVGAQAILGQWTLLLQRAGLDPSELVGTRVQITVEPDDSDEPMPKVELTGVRALLARTSLPRRVGRMLHGSGLVAAEAFDMSAMQQTGERSFAVVGGLEDLDDGSVAAIQEQARALFGREPQVDEGLMELAIQVTRVGTPIGALLLSIRNLAPMIELAPPQSTMVLVAGEENFDEQPAGTEQSAG